MNKVGHTVWSVNPDHRILLADWNSSNGHPSEVIAYHSATGDTHLITPEGAQILDIIQNHRGKISADEITEEFRVLLADPEADFDSNDIIEAFLVPFRNLELIEESAQ